jgi:hypothetical protein
LFRLSFKFVQVDINLDYEKVQNLYKKFFDNGLYVSHWVVTRVRSCHVIATLMTWSCYLLLSLKGWPTFSCLTSISSTYEKLNVVPLKLRNCSNYLFGILHVYRYDYMIFSYLCFVNLLHVYLKLYAVG